MARFGMILDSLGNVCIHSGGRVCRRRLRRRGRRRRRRRAHNGVCCCCCQKRKESSHVRVCLRRRREHGSAENTVRRVESHRGRTVGGVFCISRRHGAHGDGTIRKRHLAAKRRTSGEGEGVRGAVEREDAGKTDRDEDTKSKQNPICKGGEVPSKL